MKTLFLTAGMWLLASVPNMVIFAQQQQQSPTEVSQREQQFITSARQLTLDGRRAGEGYMNRDGTKMVFQSERVEGNPFFQMFLLDLETGDTTMVSTGLGKTTCGWIHPDDSKVMFASTHEDPDAKQDQLDELKLREEGKERRYSWDYDEDYEIYARDLKTEELTRLTNAKGYDAEGSYSPDGKRIAFASNRAAFSRELTKEEAAIFEKDKSYMMDIYIMNSDGTDVRQLTDVPGYDGGPFFSPDGQRICWRRFDEKGVTAEVMTMNIDGSDQKQLTRMRVSSFAPYYHPSGRYLIFNNNKFGFGNFELFIVDVDGQSLPVRVTESDGFDGLAAFSPDGKQIFWTSTRHDVGARKGQIYRGQWNHENALKALGLDESAAGQQEAMKLGSESAAATSSSFEARDIMRHVDYLCRKELGGRMTGTDGERRATAYVAAYLDNLGLVPDGDNGSWYQRFEFPDGAELGKTNRLVASCEGPDEPGVLNENWRPLSFSQQGDIDVRPVVFVGYGIKAPEQDGQAAYDSYGDIDVNGKWVMMFRYFPEEVDDQRRSFLQYHSSLRKKAMVARDAGAAGMIVVSGPNSSVREQLVPLENDFSNAGSSLGAISITDELATKWLAGAGPDQKLKPLQDQLDAGEMVPAFEVPSLKVAATIDVKQKRSQGRNVVGRLLAGDRPSDEAILIGAHIDHLGRGTGGSLARNEEKGKVHVGADDNASGVAALLEVAEFLAGLKRDGKLPLKRDIIFAAWSGEELGLHGSRHFVRDRIGSGNPGDSAAEALVQYTGDPHNLDQLAEYYGEFLEQFDPARATSAQLQLLQSNAKDMQVVINLLGSTAANSGGGNGNEETVKQIKVLLESANSKIAAAEQEMMLRADQTETAATGSPQPIVACLNMDMVGRMQQAVVLQGLGSSEDWVKIIEKANVVVGLPVKLADDTQLPTDASSFYRARVPILSAFTGSHTDYHTPRDTPEKLNYEDTSRIARLMGLVTRQLAISDQAPAYRKHEPKQQPKVARAGRRARLGSVPNYTEEVVGVLLDDVASDSPAEQAGLKGGDIIVKLDGKKIENIYDYQYAIEGLKVGRETDITIRRGEKQLELKIVPGSRD